LTLFVDPNELLGANSKKYKGYNCDAVGQGYEQKIHERRLTSESHDYPLLVGKVEGKLVGANRAIKPLSGFGIYDSRVAKKREAMNSDVHWMQKLKRTDISVSSKVHMLRTIRPRNLARVLVILFINYVFVKGSLKSIRKRAINPSAPIDTVKGLVSVVLPTYNHAKYLKQSIESVLNQSYSHIQLIIVNDGSNDKTRELLKEYENTPMVTVIHQENTGLPNALNRGFAIAKGEFLTWTSADNFYNEIAIQTMVDFLEVNDEVGVVYGNYLAVNENGEKLTTSNCWRSYNRNLVDPAIVNLPKQARFFKRIPINSVGPMFLYRASAAWVIGKYADTPGIEDYDFWSRMEMITTFKRLPTTAALYSYRVHDESISGHLRKEHQMKKTIEVLIRISKDRFLENNSEKLVGTAITERIYSQYWDSK
jgi:glycosyltransferase involved in cell wall biosynthesis